MVVERGDEVELVPLRAEWRPDRVEPAATVIVLTKAPDTEAALAGLEHVRGGVELAVSLQNGVEKDDVLARWCGAEAVVGGVSMVGGTLLEPGRVAHTFDGGTILGELPRGRSERVERLAAALAAGGLTAVVSDDVRAVEWAKLVHASPTMAVPALVRLPLHACLDLRAARGALRDARPRGDRDRRGRRGSRSTTARSATRCGRSPPRRTTRRSRSSASAAGRWRPPG